MAVFRFNFRSTSGW